VIATAPARTTSADAYKTFICDAIGIGMSSVDVKVSVDPSLNQVHVWILSKRNIKGKDLDTFGDRIGAVSWEVSAVKKSVIYFMFQLPAQGDLKTLFCKMTDVRPFDVTVVQEEPLRVDLRRTVSIAIADVDAFTKRIGAVGWVFVSATDPSNVGIKFLMPSKEV